MKVVLCDDHKMFVEAFASVLQARGWTVCEVSFDPAAAENAVARHRPDVAVLDLRFPGSEDSTSAIRSIARRFPATRVTLLTGVTDPRGLQAAVDAGVTAVVSKFLDIDQVVDIVEQVGRGEFIPEPRTVPVPARSDGQNAAHLLTAREREVLAGLVRGQSAAATALELGIAVSTVRSHVQGILRKFGVHTRLEAVAVAMGTAGHAASVTDSGW